MNVRKNTATQQEIVFTKCYFLLEKLLLEIEENDALEVKYLKVLYDLSEMLCNNSLCIWTNDKVTEKYEAANIDTDLCTADEKEIPKNGLCPECGRKILLLGREWNNDNFDLYGFKYKTKGDLSNDTETEGMA